LDQVVTLIDSCVVANISNARTRLPYDHRPSHQKWVENFNFTLIKAPLIDLS